MVSDGRQPVWHIGTGPIEGWFIVSTPPSVQQRLAGGALRRLVGGALRGYRENLGYTLEDAARVLECDRSKVSRIETGQRGIRARDLRELMEEYGVAEEQRTGLVLR